MIEDCLFCKRKDVKSLVLAQNDFAYASWDMFPISPGHCEVIPKWHRVSFQELLSSDVLAIFDLSLEAIEIIQKTDLAEVYKKVHREGLMSDKQYELIANHPFIHPPPDGYNIGFNEGRAAGRTIDHFHLHIIPRFLNDVPNPRGGIRNIIPGKGNY
jgi:ATP adenylyltransferase